MNREILFRGQDENGNWVEGFYYCRDWENTHWIRVKKDYHFIDHEVKPETVGQFTGLLDKNGVRIFENDIVLYLGAKGVVFYDTDIAMFMVKFKSNKSRWSFDSMDKMIEVIGMIDNQNLLTNAK